MNRPYIICHMTMSVDGKVTGEFLEMPETEPAIDVYYQINRDYHADAFACGRVTMEGSFTGGWKPDLTEFKEVRVSREDYMADSEAKYFAVAFDRRGSIGWRASRIEDDDPGYDDAHIIEVLSEDICDAYLAYLQSIRVSYIFAGVHEMSLSVALEKLKRMFGIEHLLLEGGSIINGAFLREDVVDELSLVVAPVIGAAEDKLLFDNSSICKFELKDIKRYDNSVIWMNYKHK